MLKKLLKYEIKATGRTLLPLYIILLVIAVVNRILNPFEVLENSQGFNLQILIHVISVIIYFSMAFGIMAATLIVIIQRFYKNLLGDEGYLSFTLPVETWKHILSKMIVSIMWIVLSVLMLLISILIIFDVNSFMNELLRFLEELKTVFGSGIYISLPIYMLSGMILGILIIYNSIAIGHHFQNHKLLGSFAVFGVFYLLTQTVLVVMILIYTYVTYGDLNTLSTNVATLPNGSVLFGVVSIILMIMAIGHFISTTYFLKNKLNVE